MELRNFRRGRHLYSAGQPSRWASAHILVTNVLLVLNVGDELSTMKYCTEKHLSFSQLMTFFNLFGEMCPSPVSRVCNTTALDTRKHCHVGELSGATIPPLTRICSATVILSPHLTLLRACTYQNWPESKHEQLMPNSTTTVYRYLT